jgi:hypothetical protein
MDDGFHKFLKSGGRSDHAAARVINYVKEFESYLKQQRSGGLKEAKPKDMQAFVSWIEQRINLSAKGHLWGLGYYFEYTTNEEMRQLARLLREQRIKRKHFLLKDFRSISPECVEKLAEIGIRDVHQMLEAGRTESGRIELSQRAGVSLDHILELVRLSDLARIPGVKGIRARLYLDAGVDSIEKMAKWEPDDLREMVVRFVERTEFDGIAPLPAEARFTVAQARKLPRVVEY